MVAPAAVAAMDEEAKKRSTDCVYFLASPLTCKKGDNCEFRHSETARMNPRDCRYWIHGTCRNPNCSFRHPPLEGKLGMSVPSQSVATASVGSTTGIPASALASKSKTPCYFFSQGNCTKGDKCPFMHGSVLPSSAGITSQLKPPKEPDENNQTGIKPLVVLKSVASNVSKSTSSEQAERKCLMQNDCQPANLKAASVSLKEKSQTEKAAEQAKTLRGLAIANPNRIEKAPAAKRSRETLLLDVPDDLISFRESRDDVLDVTEMMQVRSGREQQQLHQYKQEHRNSIQIADHRYQNGCKKDALWKNESSSLENDSSDLSLRGEDGEYSPRATSRGRPKLFDDTAIPVYKGPYNHAREELDTKPSNYRQACYSHHGEQQMQYASDYDGMPDHYHDVALGGRIHVRDGQRILSEGYTDLRDHLMKRRRDDKGLPSRNENLSRRGHSDTVNTSSLSRRHDDGSILKEPHGRMVTTGVDPRGIKRLRRDVGASPNGRPSRASPSRHVGPVRSPDRSLSVVSLGSHSELGFSMNEARERGRNRYASQTDLGSKVKSRSPAFRSIKSEYIKEDASFTGPKSLAQIKAEKDAELDSRLGQRLGRRVTQLEKDAKLADVGFQMSEDRQKEVASTSRLKRLHTEETSAGKRERRPASSQDFEGPKPLSELLKEKQKVESCINGPVGIAACKESKDVNSDSNREVEDGEVRDEEDDFIESRNRPSLLEDLAPQAESDLIVEASEADNLSRGVADVQDDMGFSEDEIGLDLGQTMSGDEDFELDDDDEDDFAKKLGGMFS